MNEKLYIENYEIIFEEEKEENSWQHKERKLKKYFYTNGFVENQTSKMTLMKYFQAGALATFIEVFELRIFGEIIFSPNGIVTENTILNHLRILFSSDDCPVEYTNPYQRAKKETEALVSILKYEYNVTDIREYIKKDTFHFKNFDMKIDTLNKKIILDKNLMPTLFRLDLDLNLDALNKQTPNFDKWLNGLFVKEDLEPFKMHFGSLFSIGTHGQKALALWGQGGNGKSIIGSIIETVFSILFVPFSLHDIETNKFASSRFINKLVAYDDDAKEQVIEKEEILKKLITSKSSISTESKGKDIANSFNVAKMVISTNYPIRTTLEDTAAFYRRFHIIRCKPLPLDRIDDQFLTEKILNETDAIIFYMISGLIKFIENDYTYIMSERSENILNITKRDALPTEEFVSECFEIVEDYKTPIADIHSAFELYCGLHHRNLIRDVQLKFTDRGVDVKRETSKFKQIDKSRKSIKCLVGIKIIDEYLKTIENRRTFEGTSFEIETKVN